MENLTNKERTHTSILRRINIVLVWIYLLNAMYIPADTLFNMKKIALGLLLLLNIKLIFENEFAYSKRIIGFGFFLTTFTILYSIVLTGGLGSNINSGYVGYILLLLPIFDYYEIDFVKIYISVMKIMAAFIVAMGLLHILGIVNVYQNPILMWLYYTNNAKINPRALTIIGFSIFMHATPALLLTIPYHIKYNNRVWLIITAVALFFSGTRANVLCGAACIGSCLLFKSQSGAKKFFTILFILLATSYVVAEGTVYSYVQNWFTLKESSDAVRDNTLLSIFNYWNEHPLSFITGTGFASTFYNLGRNELVSNAELSYWILLRRVGFPLFVLFMIMFLYPIKKILSEKQHAIMAVGYVYYLIIAYTNPILYGSTGMTVVLLMYYLCYCGIKNQSENNRSKIKFVFRNTYQ